MRIVALLLGLAALADRARGAPLPVRTLAMSFLRPAESVAREFVAGAAGLPALLLAHPDDDDADAERLATSFRVLAILLVGVAARLCENCRIREAVQPRRLARAAVDAFSHAAGLVFLGLRPFDTS
jgi:hypothetical protein